MANKTKWVVVHFEEVLCAVFLALMSLITFINVITRYLLKYSLAFTEELVVSLFVWVTLLGAAVAFRGGAHLGFTFITGRLSHKVQKVLLWFSTSLGAILFLFLIYFSINQVHEEVVLKITSSGIGVPQWWYTIGVPVWSVLIIVRIFQGALEANQKIGRS
jgi:TRAP-type C4-dicarboxylate transport system permease small subunit